MLKSDTGADFFKNIFEKPGAGAEFSKTPIPVASRNRIRRAHCVIKARANVYSKTDRRHGNFLPRRFLYLLPRTQLILFFRRAAGYTRPTPLRTGFTIRFVYRLTARCIRLWCTSFRRAYRLWLSCRPPWRHRWRMLPYNCALWLYRPSPRPSP